MNTFVSFTQQINAKININWKWRDFSGRPGVPSAILSLNCFDAFTILLILDGFGQIEATIVGKCSTY